MLQAGRSTVPLRKRKKKRTRKNAKRSSDAIPPSSDSSFSPLSTDHSDNDSPVPEESIPPIIVDEQNVENIITVDDEEELYHKPKHTSQNHSKPLCSCVDHSVSDIVYMTLMLGLRHGLSWVAQVDILKMFESIFKNASIPSSKSKYLNYLNIEDANESISHHIYCNVCNSYLGERKKNMKGSQQREADRVMHCDICDRNVNTLKPSNGFVSISIKSQLERFLRDKKFVNSVLSHRFNRPSKNQGEISDIYDGRRYKALSEEGGVLSSPYNFSYTFFTDGVAFGKASNKTVWPIYITINELPYEERTNYIILAGVYAGSKDPNQIYFFKPFVTEANKLSENGISWNHTGKDVKSLFIPLVCVCDSVARYQILNYQSFHATYGCTFCYKKSVSCIGGMRYILSDPSDMRTDESLKEDLLEVFQRRHNTKESERVFRGVKGSCNLLLVKYFSITYSLIVDYMHAILLGAVKTHLELSLESTRKKMWVGMNDSIGVEHLIDKIDERILAMQSNSSVIRELRSLKDRKIWRASEYRLWLLFYCIPCLSGYLKPKYLLHWFMLSKATFILLQRSVTVEEVNEAHRLLMMYTFYFQKYFKEEHMLYNIHLLSHVAKGVLDFGPIWGHSSFPHESENRYLLQLCKSPFSVALQVARKFLIYQTLPSLGSSMEICSKTVAFSERVMNYKKLTLIYERTTSRNCVLLGKATAYSSQELSQLMSEFISPSDSFDCVAYQRMIFCRKKFATSSYCVGKDNNDSCAFLHDGTCVIIHNILLLLSGKVILRVQTMKFERFFLQNNEVGRRTHLHKVLGFGEFKCISLESIAEPCLQMKTSDTIYISKIPFGSTVE